MDHHGAESESSGSKLLKGTIILGAAAIVSKLLGTLQKIPLHNIAGETVFGIYNLVYPFYILILTLATAGIPITVSKLVSEKVALGHMREARRTVKIATLMLTITGIVFFFILYFGAEHIAMLIGDLRTAKAIRSVSFALLFVPIMASLRGYFQGVHNMAPTGVSQVVEQTVRVAVMIWLLIYFTRMHYADGDIAAGATFGSAAGAAAGLFVMLYYWRKNNRAERDVLSAVAAVNEPIEPALRIVHKFIRHALPICLASVVMPLIALVDIFTMPRLLMMRGADAMAQIGIYNHGLPLVQLVSMLVTSMSVALVPAIAEAAEANNRHAIRSRTEIALRLSWIVGLASSFGLAIVAVPVNVMLFESDAGSNTMMVLAFSALFGTLQIVSATILQGIGCNMYPLVHVLIAAIVKVAGNVVLIPEFGIIGAAVSAVIAYAVAAVLNLVIVHKKTDTSFKAAMYVWKPIVAVLIMAIGLIVLMEATQLLAAWRPVPLSYRMENTFIAVVSITGGALLFGAALLRVGVIRRGELEVLPGIGRRLVPLLTKTKLLK